MKKIFVLSAIILALGAVSYLYFKVDQEQSSSKALYMAIPKSFPLALESTNWPKVFEKVDTFTYFQTLKKQDWIIASSVNLEELENLDKFLQENNQTSFQANTLLAYGNAGNSQLGILAAKRLNGTTKLSDILQAFDASDIKYTLDKFELADIVTINNDPNGLLQSASFTLSNQIFIYSHQASSVEGGLIALNNREDAWIELMEELDGKEDLKLYLKPDQLNYLASYLLKAEAFELMTFWENLSENTLLQLDLFKGSVNLSGFVTQGKATLTDTLSNVGIAGMESIYSLPSNTAMYRGVGIANNNTILSEDYDFKRMHSFINESFVLFTLESYNEKLNNRRGAILPLRDSSFLQILMELDSSVSEFKRENEVQIYVSQLGQKLNETFLAPKYFEDEVYFFNYNGQLVLSSNYAVAEQYIFAHSQGKTLRTNETFMNFKSASSSKSNIEDYINLNLVQGFLSNVLTSNTWQTLYEQVNLQFSNVGNKTYCNGKISFMSDGKSGNKSLWTTSLDNKSSFPAQVVTNHNTGKKELLIQDESNLLYLINASGEVNWKVELKGGIQSKIYQIDYYKNKKLQYVFNTEDQIYIVDRNGGLVDGFPIKLPSTATNGMLLLNYDGVGKYRYMLACDNGNIYAYEKNGSPLAGWNPKKDVGIIETPIQHVVHDGKDYIFFNNKEGVFYALNRKGENRFDPVSSMNGHSKFYFSNASFIGGDVGSSITIDLKGNINTIVLLDSTYTNGTPVNSLLQSNQAYAFTSGSNFKFQQSQWQNFASYSTEEPIESMKYFTYQNKLWFVLQTANMTYLIDEIGNLHPEFPIQTKSVSFVDLIPGKQKIMMYADPEGNLSAREIAWTNL